MNPKQRYTLGWILGVCTYAFPLVVGSMWFLRKVLPMLVGTTSYQALIHVGLVNVMFTGLSGVVFCAYGLRFRVRAFWYLHLVFVLWVVTNDLYAALRAGWTPMPLFPGTLGTISLILTISCLRKPPDEQPTEAS